MNNVAFEKTMEIVRKQRDSKLLTTKARMNYLVSGSKYHATCFFSKICKSEIKTTHTLMHKPVYLGLPKLDISETNNVWVFLWLCKTKI